jgi:hypothetical protein
MKEGNRHNQWRRQWRKVVRGGTTRLRKPKSTLAPGGSNVPPGESLSLAAPASNDGVLRANQSNHLPTALAEASEHDERAGKSWLPGPLVGTITLLALAFIALITWFIAQMPNK